MGIRFETLTYAAQDPEALARFWGGVLGFAVDGAVVTTADGAYRIRFVPSELPKLGPNQMHFDITSTSPADQERLVARTLELGGRHLDIGQSPDEPHVVLADPEGNEFCVIEPTNNFLAGIRGIGAFSSDGTQAVGYFWSKALDWPLVWDQDEETAIQSPRGGTKIAWGGPPVAAKLGPNRLRLELRVDDDQDVERLLALGATLLEDGVLADPDGNEFSIRR
ncbi:VOC family protein [Kribbella sandramycini]|uniref:Catechol 2,3-dioxygenase-like lactoylglutathione lyase family enzyme n=1 Tax=Kribbella sandramycini TaxID=60450 RepID=A0A7Y4L058_9ACTN|nr:VOC family protein [Kribbella sandramycini]MBB6569269.1 catechol 2,3-dioxygenase-like lactoylglutathione lyase family enzyme [Kribbella sandramycini]NOL40891.1 VOC family protein [Kribbella sandramycini]